MEAVNRAPEYLMGKKWVGEGKKIAPEMLGDETAHRHESRWPDGDGQYKVTYVEDGGKAHTVERGRRRSLMEGAVSELVPGIDADCGGACACATCQVYVPEDWLGRLPAKDSTEQSMLEFCPVQANSRLSLQIQVSDALDGLRLKVPTSQQ